jgi:hypothetical protein
MGWAFRYWIVDSRAALSRAPVTCELPDWSPEVCGSMVTLSFRFVN